MEPLSQVFGPLLSNGEPVYSITLFIISPVSRQDRLDGDYLTSLPAWPGAKGTTTNREALGIWNTEQWVEGHGGKKGGGQTLEIGNKQIMGCLW